jgi:hypothetical protein
VIIIGGKMKFWNRIGGAHAYRESFSGDGRWFRGRTARSQRGRSRSRARLAAGPRTRVPFSAPTPVLHRGGRESGLDEQRRPRLVHCLARSRCTPSWGDWRGW